MTIRIAAIEVSHWHAVYDAAYLRHLIAMPDVELVAIQDSDADVAAKRAAEVKNPLIFTDYRKMLAMTHPDFVVALGRHRQMAGIAHDLLDRGYPFLMEKPMGINAAEVEAVAAKAIQLGAFVAVPLWPSDTRLSPNAPGSYSPRAASARYRISTFGSTGRRRHATKLGIARGCSIPSSLAAAACETSVRMVWTCSSI
jgi:hypothetical protein